MASGSWCEKKTPPPCLPLQGGGETKVTVPDMGEALHRHRAEPCGMVQENRTREAVYLDWLTERLGSTVRLDRAACRLARFRRIRVARGNRGPEGPDATIHGTLIVTDPVSFAALLARGVGRHRAYGYGMLLLRPPSLPVPER